MRAARLLRCAVRRRRHAGTPMLASTSSSLRAAKPPVTAAKSARSCCGRKSSRRSRPCRCWPRRHWQWRADRRGAGVRCAGRVDGLAVADGGGSRAHRGPAAGIRQCQQPGHRAQPFVHRKPARMLRNDWTEAWEQPDNPKPLGMPLQYMVSGIAVAAGHKYPTIVLMAFNPVGQVVGQLTKVEKSATYSALGSGIPRGDEHAERTQRGRH